MDLNTILEAFRPYVKLMLILSALVFIGICLDYATGTLAARANHEWSSKIAREGIWHKVGIIIAVLLAVLLDIVVIVAAESVMEISISFSVFAPLVALCYVLTEFGSILENLKKMGVYVPDILTRGFVSIKHAVDAHSEAAVPAPEEEEANAALDPTPFDAAHVEDDEPPDEENM